MATAVELGEEERPAKKARLAAPQSPALSSKSEEPFDDDEDLYDTPVKALTPSATNKQFVTKSSFVESQPDTQPSLDSIPGLGLLGAESSPQFSSPKSSHTIHAQSPSPKTSSKSVNSKAGDADGQKTEIPGLSSNVAANDSPHRMSPVPVSKADEEFLKAAQANKDQQNAEWQYDTTDAEHSDSSSDSDSSDDSDEEGYQMLSVEEQALMLMQEGGGSGDEGEPKSSRGAGVYLRTANEKPDEIVEKPNVTVTPDMAISELGLVENIVENYLLIKGKISGETRVLESGSVLCLDDRSVIGVVAEPLGRVEEPRYSVAFTNAAAIQESSIDIGTKVYYVVDHTTYVFTEPLKILKGSDASNQHDEEAGGDEIEFSDDEAEAAYKRNLKQERLARKEAQTSSRTLPPHEILDATDRNRKGSQHSPELLCYDDEVDDLYTPLTRPTNLHGVDLSAHPPLDRRNLRGSGRSRGNPARGDRSHRFKSKRKGRPDASPYNNSGKQSGYVDRGAGAGALLHPAKSLLPSQSFQGQDNHPASPSSSQVTSSQNMSLPNPKTPAFQPYEAAYMPHQQMNWGHNHPATMAYQPSMIQSPTSPQFPMSPGVGIPPGAFVNPAFFRNQAQSPYPAGHFQSSGFAPYQYPPHIQPGPYQQHGYEPSSSANMQHPHSTSNTTHPTDTVGRGGSPESEAAFRLAQEKLNIIRQLNMRSSSP